MASNDEADDILNKAVASIAGLGADDADIDRYLEEVFGTTEDVSASFSDTGFISVLPTDCNNNIISGPSTTMTVTMPTTMTPALPEDASAKHQVGHLLLCLHVKLGWDSTTGG